jgi:hypothetical protein
MRIEEMSGTRVLFIDDDGPPISTNEDASDLISSAWSAHVDFVVVPVHRLDPKFFQLDTLFAGDVLQKFVNYRIRLTVVGDIRRFVAQSQALRDFVWESNRGDHVWFVDDEGDLAAKLAPRHPSIP